MKEDRLRCWGIAGFFVIFALAAGWHFLHDVVPNPVTAALSPVNESPWEHAKLFFVPALLFFFVEFAAVGKEFPNYLFAHAVALLVMPVFMLLFYFGYESLVSHTFLLDLFNTALTIALGLFIAYTLTVSDLRLNSCVHKAAAVAIVAALALLFTYFTFNPPRCGLFRERSKWMEAWDNGGFRVSPAPDSQIPWCRKTRQARFQIRHRAF
jgi:hypothetical protein